MISLRMLGTIDLETAEGQQIDELLRQPKLIALLAYIASPRPGTWHRRDALLAAFWPEADEARARTSLRNALYTLRRNLPDGTVRTRGTDDVSIDPALLSTDAGAMLDDIASGRFTEALARYTGDLLPALYIPEAEEFGQWLELERAKLKAAARAAANQLTDKLESAGDFVAASEAARQAAALDPDNETVARRLISLLDRAGDRTQALAVFERFRERVKTEFGVEPSGETLALIADVRARQAAPSAPRAVGVTSNVSPAVASQVPADAGATSAPRRTSTSWRWIVAALLMVSVGGVAYSVRVRSSASAGVSQKKLVVLPMDNSSGDVSLDYVATGFAEDVAHKLEGIGGITIRSGARSEWPAVTRHDFKAIGAQFGSTILLRSTLTRVADSLQVTASLVDVATSGERTIGARRFVIAGIQDAERQLAAAIAGAVFRADLPAVPREPTRAVDPRSYELTLRGWHQLLVARDLDSAHALFMEATTLDPLNARGWAGLSSALSALTNSERLPFDEGLEQAEVAAKRAIKLDSLQGSALANLGFLEALKSRSLAVGLEYIDKAAAVEPANPEVFLLKAALYRHAWKWDEARAAALIARELDPLTMFYSERAASLEMCAERPASALSFYDAALRVRPSDRGANGGRIRALVWLGRFDDALATWRTQARGNAKLEERLAAARGDTGYWAVVHEIGQRQLKAITASAPDGAARLLPLTKAQFKAGELDAGFASLDASVRAKEHWLYRLPCMPDFDEVRHTPRFAAILRTVGPLPDR